MDQRPGQPGDDAGEAQPADLGDGAGAADRGHEALVEVVKGAARLAGQRGQNGAGGEAPLLDGDRAD
ncbi:MAG TPA: hypothetical protein VN962_07045, partial [Polyangia bacterium]|nr:hypothetical protein [Polyangia bacterium]